MLPCLLCSSRRVRIPVCDLQASLSAGAMVSPVWWAHKAEPEGEPMASANSRRCNWPGLPLMGGSRRCRGRWQSSRRAARPAPRATVRRRPEKLQSGDMLSSASLVPRVALAAPGRPASPSASAVRAFRVPEHSVLTCLYFGGVSSGAKPLGSVSLSLVPRHTTRVTRPSESTSLQATSKPITRPVRLLPQPPRFQGLIWISTV